MAPPKKLNVPLNRVEGDLEIRVEIEDGMVTDAWCSGTMFRGFERILVGRGALDGLVITPRICGICGTCHLTAASRALDMIADVTPPPNATRVRNVALMSEHIQSDVRQTFLMFAPDLANPAYEGCDLYPEIRRRYEPFKGETVLEVIRETKKVPEVIAILGGQWPHSSYMVPGGVVSLPTNGDITSCQFIIERYRRWYEKRILGCSLDRWRRIRTAADLDAWLEERDEHRQSDLGLLIRFSRTVGLTKIGRGHANFVSYGALDTPDERQPAKPGSDGFFIPAGFVRGGVPHPFDQQRIAEHVAHSWFEDYDGGRHPAAGETTPYATGDEGRKYSWAKAPRFDGLPAETGPLAEKIVEGDPLFTDLLEQAGPNAFLRQLARAVRPVSLIPQIITWLSEIDVNEPFYATPGEIAAGEGYGLTQAARGALGHWVRIVDGRIAHYQIITPTAWHASPRDSAGIRGPIEEALIGTPVRDADNPIELGHVIRSFDPCLVCTVHTVGRGQLFGRSTLDV
ncbi:MAG: nickel-dependent hydrogenase large subunit [Kiritimatiellaeota bacterium]|nr:nickel-dependent hydrogenase large subunit [Kiritimatiellota bacterium]